MIPYIGSHPEAPRKDLVLKEDEAIINKHYLVQLLHHWTGQYHERKLPSNITFRDDDAYQALLAEVADVSRFHTTIHELLLIHNASGRYPIA